MRFTHTLANCDSICVFHTLCLMVSRHHYDLTIFNTQNLVIVWIHTLKFKHLLIKNFVFSWNHNFKRSSLTYFRLKGNNPIKLPNNLWADVEAKTYTLCISIVKFTNVSEELENIFLVIIRDTYTAVLYVYFQIRTLKVHFNCDTSSYSELDCILHQVVESLIKPFLVTCD